MVLLMEHGGGKTGGRDGERDDLKKGKEQKMGLKSKMKGGKRRRRKRILS